MRLIGILLALLWASPALAQWTQPLGVPNPGFCVDETIPADPGAWPGAEAAGFYYIDRTHGSATDTSNTYGYPDKPRLTVPTSVSAGAYIKVAGSGYTTTGGLTWTLSGASGNRVILAGVNNPDFTSSGTNQELNIRGDYWTVRGIKLSNLKVRFGQTTDATQYGCYRGNEVTGFTHTGTTSIHGWNSAAGQNPSNFVIYDNNIHDNGPLANDVDQHGVGGFSYGNNLWIDSNTFARNTGDGVQINSSNGVCCTSDPNNEQIAHHIYISRNTFNSNYQNGAWTKDARDVVFSQNTSFGHACGIANHVSCGQGPGVGMGAQYGPERVYFLANTLYDNYGGIHVHSDSQLHGAVGAAIGNVIYDNIDPSAPASPDSSSKGCITFRDWDTRKVVNNTCWGNSGGIHMTTGTTLELVNNIVGNNQNANDYDIYTDAYTNMNVANCVTANNRVRINGRSVETLASYQSATSDGENCTTSTPSFTSVPSDDYTLQSGDTVAKDTGAADHSAYSDFNTSYSIDIKKDRGGTTRPQGAAWDMGAWEQGGGGGGGGGGSGDGKIPRGHLPKRIRASLVIALPEAA